MDILGKNTQGVYIDQNFLTTSTTETLNSGSMCCLGYNKIMIDCRPSKSFVINVFTGQDRLTKNVVNADPTITTNNLFEFDSSIVTTNISTYTTTASFVMTPNVDFHYELPVKFPHYFIQAMNTVGVADYNVKINSYVSNDNFSGGLGVRDLTIGLADNVDTIRPISDFRLDVKDNNLLGYELFEKTINGSVSNDEKLLSFTPFRSISDIVRTPLTVTNMVVAGGALDNTTGIGARTLRIKGVDNIGTERQTDVNMGGNVGQLIANTFCAVNSVEVLTAGTNKTNHGDIEGEMAGSKVFIIKAGTSISSEAHFTVPKNKILYLDSISINFTFAYTFSIKIKKVKYEDIVAGNDNPVIVQLSDYRLKGDYGFIDKKIDLVFESNDMLIITAQTVETVNSLPSVNYVELKLNGLIKTTNFTSISTPP
tara:strand:+ start:75 stop:1349 length:1275 start_codon:yes stop_codon:yes gene_type:complete